MINDSSLFTTDSSCSPLMIFDVVASLIVSSSLGTLSTRVKSAILIASVVTKSSGWSVLAPDSTSIKVLSVISSSTICILPVVPTADISSAASSDSVAEFSRLAVISVSTIAGKWKKLHLFNYLLYTIIIK